jgi:hypothetical protein
MSISADQAVEAAMFLTLYRQAITTLKYPLARRRESAIRDCDNEVISDFTDRISRVYDNKIFRRVAPIRARSATPPTPSSTRRTPGSIWS